MKVALRYRLFLLLVFQVTFSVSAHAQTGFIRTYAGTGVQGFSGDNGPATSAMLAYPAGVAVDASGNLFIVDSVNGRVRKVTPGGTISTVAGNGQFGYGGDNGPATAAMIDAERIAIDSDGNLYIADVYNHRIRKVTSGGTITTVAGTGVAGYNGDGIPATTAQLNFPYGVAVDSAGNIIIADFDNNRVRKVTPGGTISTIAGTGTAGFSDGSAASALFNGPDGVAVDTVGNLFIADYFNNRVRKLTPGGAVTTVAGNGTSGYSGDGGAATSAMLSLPETVALDRAGNLYITDGGNSRVRKVTVGGVITTVLGNGGTADGGDGGPATSATINYPYDATVDVYGNLYVADLFSHRIRKIDSGAVPTFSSSILFRGDFNGDARADILWQNANGSVSIWLMNGLTVTSAAGLLGSGTGFSVKQTGDFNGDGRTDIVWEHTDGRVTMWLMNGATVSSAGGLLGPGSGLSLKQTGDFNGDGRTDILWQNVDGSFSIWLMNGLTVISSGVLIGPGTGWAVKAIGDFNFDLKSDVLWQHTDGSTTLWLMNGTSFASAGGLLGPNTGWSVKAVGDLNNDGRSDIVWQHIDGSTSAWLMSGLSMTSGGGLLGAGTGWSVRQLGDLNFDGTADIVWQHTNGNTSAWLMSGLNMTSGAGFLGAATGWSAKQIGDLNGDGRSDIVWQNLDGSIAAWLMNGLGMTSGAGFLGPSTGWSPVP